MKYLPKDLKSRQAVGISKERKSADVTWDRTRLTVSAKFVPLQRATESNQRDLTNFCKLDSRQ
jgi:hypothetical protein